MSIQSNHVRMGGQAISILQALAEGIANAGGIPDLDLLRILNQKGIKDQFGQILMANLYVTVAKFEGFQADWTRQPEEMIAAAGWKFVADHKYEKFPSNSADGYVSTWPSRRVACELQVVQRPVSLEEVNDRLSRGWHSCNIMEFVNMAEKYRQHPELVGRTLVMPRIIDYYYLIQIDLKKREVSMLNTKHSPIAAGTALVLLPN